MRNVCDVTEIEYGFPVSSQIILNSVNFRRRNWICLSDTHSYMIWICKVATSSYPYTWCPFILSFICRLHIFLVSCYYFNPLFLCNISFFTKSGVFFLSQDTSVGDCGDFDSKIDSHNSSALPTPLRVTVCRLHTTQRLGCALISDVYSAAYSGGRFGEVEIEWRNERRSCLKFSGDYNLQISGVHVVSESNLNGEKSISLWSI
jgi:hypothetical protein